MTSDEKLDALREKCDELADEIDRLQDQLDDAMPAGTLGDITDHKPLFGNKQPNRTGTHWIVWMKAGSGDDVKGAKK